MLPNRFILSSYISLTILIVACKPCLHGEGDIQEEERILPDFNKIQVECSANLILHPIDDESKNKIVLYCQPNLFPIITSREEGGCLNIRSARCFQTNQAVDIHAFVHGLDEVQVSGSGNLSCDSLYSGDKFKIVQQGSGDIRFNAKMQSLTIEHTGSGHLMLSGHGNSLVIHAGGSGATDTRQYVNNNCEVNLNGSGDVYVNAVQETNLNLHGSGSIYYAGRPATLNTHNDGSGEIRQSE